MKLLALSPILPDAPSDGDRLRLFHFLRELSKWHRVTLACFGDPAVPAVELRGMLQGLHVLPMPRARQWANAGLRYFHQAPSNVNAFASPEMAGLVDGLLERGGFDAAFCYRLRMAPYALRARLPRVVDFTDSLTRYFERRAAQAYGLKRWIWLREAGKIAACESWMAGQFDACFMNSAADTDTLSAMAPGARVLTASNGADLERLRPQYGRREAGRMLFVGNLAYAPNAQALLWFARGVLPLIHRKRPGARLAVVGSNLSPALRGLAGRVGVEFGGFNADLNVPHARAAISVCPVFLGAGRQNKVLDAFATATPVVASSLAARGVEAEPGRQLLAADSPDEFAAACLKLMDRPALARRLASHALRFARRRYRWSRGASVIHHALEQACSRA